MGLKHLHKIIWVFVFILLILYLVLLTGCTTRHQKSSIIWMQGADCALIVETSGTDAARELQREWDIDGCSAALDINNKVEKQN